MYKSKYLKYKQKYNHLKSILGGAVEETKNITSYDVEVDKKCDEKDCDELANYGCYNCNLFGCNEHYSDCECAIKDQIQIERCHGTELYKKGCNKFFNRSFMEFNDDYNLCKRCDAECDEDCSGYDPIQCDNCDRSQCKCKTCPHCNPYR